MAHQAFRPLLCIALLLFGISGPAQNYWLGGTPGKETKWNEPRNWSTGRAPGEGGHVVIPDQYNRGCFYPVIDQPVETIAYLRLEDGAQLTITTGGTLGIDGSTSYNFGLYLVGELYNEGSLVIAKTELPSIGGRAEGISGSGQLLLIDEQDRVVSLN